MRTVSNNSDENVSFLKSCTSLLELGMQDPTATPVDMIHSCSHDPTATPVDMILLSLQ
jgi:hypothetical protein